VASYSYPVVTGLTAAFLGILQVILTLNVIGLRFKTRIYLGDGGNKDLDHRVRMHGNLTENAPIFLILLGLFEMTQLHPVIVDCLGPAFVVSRIFQAIGLLPGMAPGPNPLRFMGTLGSFMSQIILSIALLLTLAPHFSS
jgi:uncharacterized protein